MSEEEIKQLAEKELVNYLTGRDFGLCPTSKYYMANHIEEILKSANATKELTEENNRLKEQIKKMKCCSNCARDYSNAETEAEETICDNCINESNWKLKE